MDTNEVACEPLSDSQRAGADCSPSPPGHRQFGFSGPTGLALWLGAEGPIASQGLPGR